MLAKLSGVVPKASTGPPELPERTVIKSVATLLVNFRVFPATAPVIVEYSPANEQVEIVDTAPAGSIAADPKDELFKQGPGGGAEQTVHCTVVVRQAFCVPQALFVLQ